MGGRSQVRAGFVGKHGRIGSVLPRAAAAAVVLLEVEGSASGSCMHS